MDSEYKRRIADHYLHPLVKEWWYGLTETQRKRWLDLVAIEKSKANSRTKHTL